MQSIDLDVGAAVSGGLSFSAFLATLTTGPSVLGSLVRDGIPPDYSRTTAMGDMY